jgi:hypothetical protein
MAFDLLVVACVVGAPGFYFDPGVPSLGGVGVYFGSPVEALAPPAIVFHGEDMHDRAGVSVVRRPDCEVLT